MNNCKYRVYLTTKDNKQLLEQHPSKEDVRKRINEANQAGYKRYLIIMNMQGTDITVSRGKLNNKDKEVEIKGLDDEWIIREDGTIVNNTKFQQYLLELKSKGEER